MNGPRAEVCILLPLYNGQRYLAQQLDSLLAQTHDNWHCVMRDDGSTDDSRAIADAYCARHPHRFRRIEDTRGNLGVVGCLNALSGEVRSPYFALCDQDDVWLPEKLALCLRELARVSEAADVPALTVSDLALVDAQLRPLGVSFWQWRGYGRYVDGLACLPVFNAFPGCTMVGNLALLRAAFPVPPAAPMHDYWLGLVAKYGGRVAVSRQALVLYRQHGGNQCGAGETPSLARRLWRRLGDLRAFFEQARRSRRMRLELLELLPGRLCFMPGCAEYHEALAAEKGTPFMRLAFLRRHGIPPNHAFIYWLG